MRKAKNGSVLTLRSLIFVALWGMAYSVAWGAAITLIQQIGSRLPAGGNNILGIVCVTLIPALIQVQIAERLLKHRMRGWMLYTVVGTLLTFFIFRPVPPSEPLSIPLTALLLLLPTAFVQTVWLHRYVKSAWLWPLASVTASLVFAFPMRSSGSVMGMFLLAGLLYGLIQGSVMRYLCLQPKETEKTKVDTAQANETFENRAIHLQETAQTPDC